MHVPPRHLDPGRLRLLLRDGWGLVLSELTYLPVGFGSHHWLATTLSGEQRFLTVDELDADEAARTSLVRLRDAAETATALHERGLEFVAAPLRGTTDQVIESVDDRFAVAVLPFLDGRPWEDDTPTPSDRFAALLPLLARLHSSPRHRLPVHRDSLRIEARTDLDEAVAQLERPWRTGPFAEHARRCLTLADQELRRGVRRYDVLAAECRTRPTPWVVTHGEPKADNVLQTAAGPVLVDWDTVLLAPAARDLWWLTSAHDGEEVVAAYAELTGQQVHPADLELYRLRWELTDIALFVRDLRRPHERHADIELAAENLELLLRRL